MDTYIPSLGVKCFGCSPHDPLGALQEMGYAPSSTGWSMLSNSPNASSGSPFQGLCHL